MRTIELECPGCKAMLELDAGFAGGVCRCFKCGTLMTVPSNPASEKAEKLIRPERPEGPSVPSPRRPDAPAKPAPAHAQDKRPAAPTPIKPKTKAPAPAAAAAADSEIYTTASGKQIRVQKRMVVTARSKRKMIRGSVIAIFIVLVVLTGAGVVFAVLTMLRPTGAGGPSPEEMQRISGGYDPTVNPFTMGKPNMLGVPLAGTSVVTIDASSTSASWIRVAEAAVRAGVYDLPASAKFQVILWVEGGFAASPTQPATIGAAEREALTSFFEESRARGSASPVPAIQKALSEGVTQVVIVTSRSLEDREAAAVEEAFKSASGVKLDVIMIGGEEAPRLQKLAGSHKGRYVSLPQNQINNWYRMAEDAGLLKK